MGYDRTGSCRAATAPLHVEQLGLVEYRTAWDAQRAHAAARRDGTGPDVLMLLEHPPVYTAGKRTRPADRPTDGTPVVDVDRGGLITWHGPGQLVGYPLVALAAPLDVVDYVRRLEEALIAVVEGMGLRGAGRVDGRTGVWLPADDRGTERKVAAIGVRVQGGVTMHGFALNCDPDLDLVRPHRPVRHHRRRRDIAVRRARPARGRRRVMRDRPQAAVARRAGRGASGRRARRGTPDAPAGLDLRLHPALQ